MIGTLDPHEKEVTIVGAGISGLLIAYVLKKKGFKVSVYEASSHAGGLVETLNTPFGMVERAAHSLLVGPELTEFFNELNVNLAPLNSESKARYIYRNGKMRRFPLTFLETLATIRRFFSAPKTILNLQSCTLEEWSDTYLGEPATQFLITPFVSGVYACAPVELNARITFPRLVPTNPLISLFKHFRVSKAKNPKKKYTQMMVPVDGMQTIVEKLRFFLQEEIHFNIPIDKLPNSPNLILSVPAPSLAKLIAKEDPVSASKLLQVKYAPLITVTCFYRKSAFKRTPRGIGVLIPRNEGFRLLGCLFNSSSFPNRVKDSSLVSLTAMYGGTADPEILKLPDTELTALLEKELKILLGAQEAAIHLEITRHPRAIPIYSQVLKDAQDSLKIGFASHPGRVIFSNFSKDVSIRALIEALQRL